MKLSVSQAQRYARHIFLDEIGSTGQLRLLAASVQVEGAGAAAEEAIRYLVAAGVGSLVVSSELLDEHADAWADLNDGVVVRSIGECVQTIDLQGSESRLDGARAALNLLVDVGVEAQA